MDAQYSEPPSKNLHYIKMRLLYVRDFYKILWVIRFHNENDGVKRHCVSTGSAPHIWTTLI